MKRSGSLIILLLLLSLGMFIAVHPPVRAEDSDDNIPGVPLPESPVAGDLAAGSDNDDVYEFTFFDGRSDDTGYALEVCIKILNSQSTMDFYVFAAGATDIYVDLPMVPSKSEEGCKTYVIPPGPPFSDIPEWHDVRVLEGSGAYELEHRIIPDNAPPSSTYYAPAEWKNAPFIIDLQCSDDVTGCKETYYRIDDGPDQLYKAPFEIGTEGDHVITYHSVDNVLNVEEPKTAHARLDITPPAIGNIQPSGPVADDHWTDGLIIQGEVFDEGSGVDTDSVEISLDGGPPETCVLEFVPVGLVRLVCQEIPPPAPGEHTIRFDAIDNAGNANIATGSFTVPRNYYWSWYDSGNMDSWMMLAQPAGETGNLIFGLSIAGSPEGLADQFGLGPGVVPPAHSLASTYPGVMAGPVKAASLTGDRAVVSQRSLMGNSFEEVLGADAEKLSSHFYWTWYDQLSPGFANWVLAGNPGAETVFYQIRIGDVVKDGQIDPGLSVEEQFSGNMGGPVELLACASPFDPDGGCSAPARVVASQRVLSNSGAAFNEVPGIPVEDLASSYVWTWYDSQSPGYQDWIMITNPDTVNAVDYEIWVAGQPAPPEMGGSGQIPPGETVTPVFPGVMNGPVELTVTPTGSGDGKVIASQRIIAGPSFEEVPGYPRGRLGSTWHWTWYDMVSSGSANWIMIANTSESTVDYQIRIAGQDMPLMPGSSGLILPGDIVAPMFPGWMDGPVEVTATGGTVMVSQRVSWNGYFNEVLGTVLE